ncbi:hypothetical protein D3C73_874450 [compost metagenome]
MLNRKSDQILRNLQQSAEAVVSALVSLQFMQKADAKGRGIGKRFPLLLFFHQPKHIQLYQLEGFTQH